VRIKKNRKTNKNIIAMILKTSRAIEKKKNGLKKIEHVEIKCKLKFFFD
jgi:hypothetical protein